LWSTTTAAPPLYRHLHLRVFTSLDIGNA